MDIKSECITVYSLGALYLHLLKLGGQFPCPQKFRIIKLDSWMEMCCKYAEKQQHNVAAGRKRGADKLYRKKETPDPIFGASYINNTLNSNYRYYNTSIISQVHNHNSKSSWKDSIKCNAIYFKKTEKHAIQF